MNGSTMVNAFALSNPGPSWVITGIGDFNGDGNSDIYWQNSSNGQDAVWLMNGSTVVSTAIVSPSNAQLSGSSAAFTPYAASLTSSAPAATQTDLSSSLVAPDRTPVLGINQHA
jgi:hypothetical protein